jgi:hypothetical protein
VGSSKLRPQIQNLEKKQRKERDPSKQKLLLQAVAAPSYFSVQFLLFLILKIEYPSELLFESKARQENGNKSAKSCQTTGCSSAASV